MLTRRTMNALLVGGAIAAFKGQTQSTARRPNIVLIYADDLGYGDLGVYGHPTIRTPNLNKLAAEGIRFTQFYSAASVCTPSRAALMTGRLPIRSGLNQVLFPWSEGGIPKEEVTIADGLKGSGYATACVGKWHLGHLPQYLPTRHGFDSYFGIPYSNDMSPKTAGSPAFAERFKNTSRSASGTPLFRNDEVIENEPDQSRLTSRYTEESVKFIRDASSRKQPFFLYLAHTFPHVPLFASDRFRGKSPRGLYGDVVEELDWSVGEIVRTLDELGLRSDTLILFSSDNGPWLVKHEEGGSAGLLREGKASSWEGGFREPFIASWPGHIQPGAVTESFGTTMDLFPTLLSLAGASIPANRTYDGADLTPVLFHGKPGRSALHFYYVGTDLRAIRKGDWKLHLVTNNAAANEPPVKHDPPLLFNLSTDPSEKYDVAGAYPEVIKELLAELEHHRKSVQPGRAQT